MNKRWLTVTAAALLILLAVVWLLKDRILPRSDGGLHGAIVILLDTVRADHLSCYGYERKTTPHLDALAEKGVLFEQVVSFCPWTLPSVANLLSGCQPVNNVFNQTLKVSVVESIAAAGYRTAAFTEGAYVSAHYGFDRGFGTFHEEEGRKRPEDAKPWDPRHSGVIEKTFGVAKEWLTENGDEKFFVLIHTYEPHIPYTRRTFADGLDSGRLGEAFGIDEIDALQKGELVLDDGELEYVKALYDGGLLESDRHVGELLRHLESLGLRDRTLVVVTSDHGEEFGDHYPSHTGDHGHSLHDELILVPLIVHNPLEQYPVKRVPAQIRLMDIMPTVAELLEAPLLSRPEGKSLLPLLSGSESAPRPAFGGLPHTGPNRFFLRLLGYKYIETVDAALSGNRPLRPEPPAVQLYDLGDDPRERDNLEGFMLDLETKMQDYLSTVLGSISDIKIPEDAEGPLRERLKALGYIR